MNGAPTREHSASIQQAEEVLCGSFVANVHNCSELAGARQTRRRPIGMLSALNRVNTG